MNSFTLTAVGIWRVTRAGGKNDSSYARFCLVGNDYAARTRGRPPAKWYQPVVRGVRCHGRGTRQECAQGDQLFIEAGWRQQLTDKQGEKQYDHSFMRDGSASVRPGKAKREEREAPA